MPENEQLDKKIKEAMDVLTIRGKIREPDLTSAVDPANVAETVRFLERHTQYFKAQQLRIMWNFLMDTLVGMKEKERDGGQGD